MFSVQLIIKLVLVAIVAYIVGNISPARLIGRRHGIDITSYGSGNPGTTNVIRILGLKAGLLTLVIDMLKGFIAVRLGFALCWPYGAFVAFVFVLLGHCYPMFYKFKGGKGVAAALGAAFALNWPTATLAFVVAIIVLLIDERMSVASLCAAVVYPVLMWRIAPDMLIFSIVVAVFIFITHIPNIRRITAGEEPKLQIGEKLKSLNNKE